MPPTYRPPATATAAVAAAIEAADALATTPKETTMTAAYTTRHDAIAYVAEIIENGQALADEFNVDAIVDDCFTFNADAQAFLLVADSAEFWESVQRHAYAEFPARFEEGALDATDAEGKVTGWTVLTLVVGVDHDDAGDVEIDTIPYITDAPEEPEDRDDLDRQLRAHGWHLVDAEPVNDEAYRVARTS